MTARRMAWTEYLKKKKKKQMSNELRLCRVQPYSVEERRTLLEWQGTMLQPYCGSQQTERNSLVIIASHEPREPGLTSKERIRGISALKRGKGSTERKESEL